MDRFAMVLLAAVMTVLIAVKSADAVKCYHCVSGKSDDGKACSDLTDTGKEKFGKNCDDLAAEELRDLGIVRNYTMCRIFYQDVEGDSRVVRSCATRGQPERGCIDRTGTARIKLRYCECKGDLCNGSSALSAAILMTSLVAISAYVLGRH